MTNEERFEAATRLCYCGVGAGAVPLRERQDTLQRLDDLSLGVCTAGEKRLMRLEVVDEWFRREVEAILEKCACPPGVPQ